MSTGLEKNLVLLDSSRITSRKAACEFFSSYFDNLTAINTVNAGPVTWNDLFNGITACIHKDVEKIQKDAKLGKNSLFNAPGGDAFVCIVRNGVKQEKLNIKTIIGYITGCLNLDHMKFYEKYFFGVIKDDILVIPSISGELQQNDWIDLYKVIKSLCDKLNSKNELELLHLKTFRSLVEVMPQVENMLKNEFTFITKICKNVKPKAVETMLELMVVFLNKMISNYRYSCCKIGEEIFNGIAEFYQFNLGENSIQSKLIIEIFLILVKIHNPNGSYENEKKSYAFSWNSWKSCLKKMYTIMNKEISYYIQGANTATHFFNYKNNEFQICDNFSELFVEVCNQLFVTFEGNISFSVTMQTESESMDENPNKRKRIELNISSLISNIESSNLTWICLVEKLIKKYPQVLKKKYYKDLISLLCSMLNQKRDINQKNYIYKFLSTLISIEEKFDFNINDDKMNLMWKIISENIIRAMNIVQNDTYIQELIQMLLIKNRIDIDLLYQTYFSGILTENNVKSLEILLQYIYFSKNSKDKHIELVTFCFNENNMKDNRFLITQEFANMFVNLCLKETLKIEPKIEENEEILGNTLEIYSLKNFEKLLKNDLKVCKFEKPENNHVNLDFNLLKFFLNEFFKINSNIPSEDIKTMIFFTEFLIKICDILITYKVCSEDFKLFTLIQINFGKMEEAFTNLDYQKHENLCCLNSYLNYFNMLLVNRKNDELSEKVKSLLPMDLLTVLFTISKNIGDLDENTSILSNLRTSTVKTLAKISMLNGTSCITETQQNILEVILDMEVDFKHVDDFELMKSVFSVLKECYPNTIPSNHVDKMINIVVSICEERFDIRDTMISIIQIINDLLPHTLKCTNRDDVTKMLEVFYDKRTNFDEKFTIGILRCIRQLYKVGENNSVPKWDNEEVIKYVPQLICDCFIEIRFEAIKTLATFFEVTTNTKKIDDFHRQEIVFNKIYEVCLFLLDTSQADFEYMDPIQKTDEIHNRTATVLHCYASIINSSHIWIQDSIYALLKLVFLKNLTNVQKIISLLEKEMHYSFLENNLEYIIEKWLQNGYLIDSLPFKEFNCINKNEFYDKYLKLCVPLLLEIDGNDLLKSAKRHGIHEEELFEESCAKIFTNIVNHEIDNLSERVLKNHTFRVLPHPKPLVEVLANNIDEIIICLINLVTDESFIKDNFNEEVLFFSKHLNFKQFLNSLKFIEAHVLKSSNIIHYFIVTKQNKLEQILLKLKIKIYEATSHHNKLQCFSQYVFLINLILKYYKNNLDLQNLFYVYFVKEVTYALIYLIENNSKDQKMSKIFVEYFYDFIKNVLQIFPNGFENLMVFVVNSLNKFILNKEHLKNKCLEIVKYLIMENTQVLKIEIQKLDNFPDTSEFSEINVIHKQLKYKSNNVKLVDEIKFFLESENNLDKTREGSLNSLKKLLSIQKQNLAKMFEKLKGIRGFSEDCEESLLHRLIASLIKMTSSSNKNVSTQALNCLGEIGPGNLTTLVLQPEKTVKKLDCTIFERITGTILTLLSSYIFDSNVKVCEVSSKAMYIVLKSKEGRKCADSDLCFLSTPINKDVLSPYMPDIKNNKSSAVHVKNTENFIEKLNNAELWSPSQDTNHEKWIVDLVTTILSHFNGECHLPYLVDICKLKPEMCEELLPLLIYFLLCSKKAGPCLTENISNFFQHHWTITVNNHIKPQDFICLNRKSAKCMLNIVNFIRLQRSYESKPSFGDFELDYLKVAKCAQYCEAHFTTLLYSELWCQKKKVDMGQKNISGNNAMLDTIYETVDSTTAKTLHSILRNAYKAIGELDALLGCGNSFLLDPEFRVEHYKDINQWDQVAHYYGMTRNRSELMSSYMKCNAFEMPLFCTKDLEESQYECLWRLGEWTHEEKTKNEISFSKEAIEKYKFLSLKSIYEHDKFLFEESVKLKNKCIIENLRHVSLESSKNIYPILMEIQSKVEVEDFFENCEKNNLEHTLEKWSFNDSITADNDFQFIEPIVAQRISMLNAYLSNNLVASDNIFVKQVSMMLDFADLARTESQFRISSRTLHNLQNMANLDDIVKAKIEVSQAQLYWALNDTLSAKQIVNNLIKNKSSNVEMKILKALALKLLANWKVETYSDNRQTITDHFLQCLKEMMEYKNISQKEASIILEAYNELASFADREYQQILAHMNSEAFQKKISNLKNAKETAAKFEKQKNTRDESRAQVIHQRQCIIDETEIASAENERDKFLKLALKYYICNLTKCDKNNMNIFRIVSLFLENRKNSTIKQSVDTQMPKIPSYKYINVLPQLIPHLVEPEITNIIGKCAKDHPHHVIPLLLSLANSNEDRVYADSKTNTCTNDARISAAKNLLIKLQKEPDLKDLITKMNQVAISLIELAYHDEKAKSDRKKEFNIPRSLGVTKIKGFDEVLLPTVNLPVNVENKYENIIGIHSFNSVYFDVGGINRPKRIHCRGTNGREYTQLVKGQDDLRQDSVMQQVFNIMNSLLAKNKQTVNLLIRTYKIVPLSMRSGVLEWVDNSMAIGEYLQEAHTKYNKRDITSMDAQDKFKRAHGVTLDRKLSIYKAICERFTPVFHKFFEESFPHATIWYERRRAYINSVATTSMCGYILGIGDRHVNNILIDKNTAELIHIDFGIAFEQGRVLPTPETIPFRLTRDIEDGMGISGVEGIFKSSCQKTMEVLRKNSQTILTILEVLLYDPLYAWTVTPAEANKRQTDDDESSQISSHSEEDPYNITAERALMRLKNKLQGTEMGTVSNIEHQVTQLIQQARDPENLCRVYYGWRPYF